MSGEGAILSVLFICFGYIDFTASSPVSVLQVRKMLSLIRLNYRFALCLRGKHPLSGLPSKVLISPFLLILSAAHTIFKGLPPLKYPLIVNAFLFLSLPFSAKLLIRLNSVYSFVFSTLALTLQTAFRPTIHSECWLFSGHSTSLYPFNLPKMSLMSFWGLLLPQGVAYQLGALESKG